MSLNVLERVRVCVCVCVCVETQAMESGSRDEADKGNRGGREMVPKRSRGSYIEDQSGSQEDLKRSRTGCSQPDEMRRNWGSSSTIKEASSSVAEMMDIGATINDPVCSGDVQFLTKDGDLVSARRSVLAKMSPVFSAMLTNGVTLESTSACVPLPSIPTAAFLPILEHLYTGCRSPSFFPLSLSTAPLVLQAARFLLLSSLEEAIASFFADSLHTLLLQDAITLLDAPKYLSQALDMSLPHTHVVLSRLASIIADAPVLDLKTVACLSPEALSFFLEKTRIGSLRLDESEYRRFRCVVLWCALQMDSSELTEALCNYLPIEDLQVQEQDRSSLLQKLKHFMPELQTIFEPWLPLLDFYRIHSDTLTEVVVPMDIIPHSYLMHVLAFQAHYSKDMIYLRWKQHNDSDDTQLIQLSVLDDAHTIKCWMPQSAGMARSSIKVRVPGSMSSCLTMPPRFVRAELPITRTMRAYEWDFVIEKGSNFMALGFCSIQGVVLDTNAAWLGYQPFGWVLSYTGELFNGRKVGKPYAARFGAGARVRVHLDMIKSTCSFTVNSKAYGIAWTNVPNEVYPAAALTVPGRVRIEAAGDERKKRLVECLNASLSGA